MCRRNVDQESWQRIIQSHRLVSRSPVLSSEGWPIGRAPRLENGQTERFRGFESLTLLCVRTGEQLNR